MWPPEKITLVNDRLEFIKELTDVSDHFKGFEKVIYRDGGITHSYLHFYTLRIYLALTCFDILGQSNDWKDFNSWLRSNSKMNERQIIIEKFRNNEPIDLIKSVHEEYLNNYGVKRGFIRFIREILSNQDRDKLFGSIKAQMRITEEIIHPDGTKTPPTGKAIELSDYQKEKFLFDIRNSFTHNGIVIGNTFSGIFRKEHPGFSTMEDTEINSYTGIYRTKIGEDQILFKVKKWPFVLTEIIENTIN